MTESVRTLIAQAAPAFDSGAVKSSGSIGGFSGGGDVTIKQFNRAIWQNSDGSAVQWSGRKLDTPGEVIAALYPYLFSIAGLILFVMLVWGAFEIMLGANDSKSVESGKKRITSAVIGFLILFLSFWIGQIIQYVFGLDFGLPG